MVDQRSNEVKILTKQHFSWFFTKLERLKDFWPLWPSLTKFDLRLILGGPKNPNFDPTVRMGWNQCHCKDYQILISTTIHGSKSMLDWSRYHENRDNASINAHLTSKSHNFRSDCWIFKIHTFLEIGSQDLSRGSKIKPVWGGLKVAALEGPPPRKSCWGYKKPQAHKKKKDLPSSCALPGRFLHLSPLSQTKNTQNTHIKASWFFSSPKHKVLFLYVFKPLKTQLD